MSLTIRRFIPQTIVSIILIIMIIFYYFYINKSVSDAFTTWDKALSDWAVIITSFTLIIGGIDLLRYHLVQIKKIGVKQLPFSGTTIALEIIMVIFALIGLYYSYVYPKLGVTITTQPQFTWLYTYLYAPTDSAVYSILLFYIASASYRAFIARNPMATLLLITAIVIMLGNTSLGNLIWPGFLPLRDWIMTVPNTAAFRPITMGVGFGTIILGLRLIMWREVSWLGRRE